MNLRTLLVAGSLVAAGLSAAHAVPISYKGVLVSGVPDSGNVGGFSWFLNQGSGVDFWEFSAAAGSTITLRVDRLNGNLDPALSFYKGTTTADVSTFNSAASFGGLTFIGSLDDENPPFIAPGGFSGDPFGTFAISTTGLYTVAVGGSDSTDPGVYPYRITMSVNAVPEPSIYLLMAMGLAGIGWVRRRKT
jgi:Bacterial pre-peptidase C-terminal domain/PEP-CTERM motif